MLNVMKIQSDFDVKGCSNVVTNCRHYKQKRKAVMEQQGVHKRARPINTSTPVCYRDHNLDTDVSTDGSLGSINTTLSSGCSLGKAGQNKTNLSGGTEKAKIDLEKPPETPIQFLIAYTITIDSFHEAEYSYSCRENKRQELGDNSIREWGSRDEFKANKSDSHSLEQSVLLGNLGLKLLFSQATIFLFISF